MYKSFYKLQLNPFGNNPDPRFLCMLPHTREALACLEYGISARKGFMVLTGEVGTGKTTLLRRALSSMNEKPVYTSFVFNPRLDVLEFLEFVLNDFGVVPERRSKAAMLSDLNRFLIDRFARGETCVVIIDEAQNLPEEMLEEVRLLTNLETDTEKLLQLVLSGQPELEQKLREPALRQLRQRIALWCRTLPLSEEQTFAYIAARLMVAGRKETLFEPAAIHEVYRSSGGIPRLINLICEHSLLLGYADQQLRITAATVRTVAADLDLELTTERNERPMKSFNIQAGRNR